MVTRTVTADTEGTRTAKRGIKIMTVAETTWQTEAIRSESFLHAVRIQLLSTPDLLDQIDAAHDARRSGRVVSLEEFNRTVDAD